MQYFFIFRSWFLAKVCKATHLVFSLRHNGVHDACRSLLILVVKWSYAHGGGVCCGLILDSCCIPSIILHILHSTITPRIMHHPVESCTEKEIYKHHSNETIYFIYWGTANRSMLSISSLWFIFKLHLPNLLLKNWTIDWDIKRPVFFYQC